MSFAPESVNPFNLPSLPLEWRKGFPKCSAIYFAISGENIVYIGKANNLLQRWIQHHRQAELETMGFVKIAWLEVSDIQLLPIVERALIQHFKPHLNQRLIKVRKPKGSQLNQQDTQFKPEGQEALSRKVIGVKVSMEIESALKKLPATERGKWLRRVITEAVKTELLKDN